MNNNVGDCLKRWRDVNNIEKLKERIKETEDDNVIDEELVNKEIEGWFK